MIQTAAPSFFRLATTNVKYRSQLVAYSYFLVSALLFLLQIIFGLIIASQYVWPTTLMDVLPFNIGRETHLNLMIFWLLLGLMGASYYLIPEESESELFSIPLAYLQLVVLLIAGVGTLLSFWITQASMGKPFTESPMPFPILIAVGVVLFLINLGMTLWRAKRWNAISSILFAGMAALAVLYLINFVYFPNLVVDYYWWWWIIHLWVEGAWELIAASIGAWLLIRITGVERGKMYRWLYAEVALALFTGIIGIGHHYYWIGTPAYWLFWGALFSALEPLPLVLMMFDALTSMRHRRIEPSNRVVWFFMGGSAIAHFFGAGVWGFVQTLPDINQWTHGTQITASHGHFAFFGAFGMLVLGAIYLLVPEMKGETRIQEGRGLWGFWLMSMGMLFMVAAFTVAGIVQVYLWRVIGMDFMVVRTQYMSFWMFWVFFFGLTLFTPGVLIFVWDFFNLGAKRKVVLKPARAGATE